MNLIINNDSRAAVTEGAPPLRGGKRSQAFVLSHALRADGFDASEDGTGRGTPLVACTLPSSQGGASSGMHPVIPIDMRQSSRGETMTNNRPGGSSGGAPGTGIGEAGDPSPSLSASHPPAVAAFQSSQSGMRVQDTHATLDANNGSRRHNGVLVDMAVRRLTPRECERLQGFPDDFTLVPFRGKPASDGPRYQAIGNSIATPCLRWIGERIEMAEAALKTQ